MIKTNVLLLGLFIILYLNIKTKTVLPDIILTILIGITIYNNLIKVNKNYCDNKNEINEINESEINVNEIEENEICKEENDEIDEIEIEEIEENEEKRDEIENEIDYLFRLFCSSNEIDIMKKLDIGTYIIWNSYNQYQIDAVYDKIVKISTDRRYNNKIRSNAIDILMRSNNKKYMDSSIVMLERLRQEERNQENVNDIHKIRRKINNLKQHVVHNPFNNDENDIELQHVLMNQIHNLQMRENDIIANQNRRASVYNDTQNVHNSEINTSVINVATSLLNSSSSPSDMLNIDEELKKYYPEYENHKEQINNSLNRIRTEQTKFKDGITIPMVFDKIVGFISGSIHKPELVKRLGEELYEMNGLCSTGHMARIVNVIQGFNDLPEELKIKINPKDEIYANIQSFISSEIQKSDNYEQLMDDMMDTGENHKRFVNFVSEKMRNKVKELRKDYNGIIDETTLMLNIEDSLMNYLKSETDVKTIMNGN
jgi:hypothetical protein